MLFKDWKIFVMVQFFFPVSYLEKALLSVYYESMDQPVCLTLGQVKAAYV